MPMTVIVTRDVADRYHGFLVSIMPEVAPGVFTSPELSKGVRERIWEVLSEWWYSAPGGGILMVWKDDAAPGRLGVRSLGVRGSRLKKGADGRHWGSIPARAGEPLIRKALMYLLISNSVALRYRLLW
jgi:CRISPR-associated protein Cas2